MELIERIEKAETELKELKSIAIRLASEKEEKFKVGDWVVNTIMGSWCSAVQGATMFRYGEGFIGQIENVGFSKGANEWAYAIKLEGGVCGKSHSQIRLATPQEIEAHLLKEKEKEGWVKGAMIKEKGTGKVKVIDGLCFTKVANNGQCTVGKMQVKYNSLYIQDVDNMELLPSYPQITINGHKAKFEDWGLSFNDGCDKIDKELFIKANDLINEGVLNGNKSITSMTFGAGPFTGDQIREIAKHYDK